MKNTILISFVLSICITAFGVAYSQAAEVHSLVTDKISSGQDYVKVIIRLSDRLSKNELENRLSLASYTRQAAHSLAVTSLKQHARQSQARLLDYLNGHGQDDGVRFVKSYWLDNVIRAEVRSDLVDELAEFSEIEKIYPDLPVSIIEPVEDFQPISKKAAGAGENLRVIGADSLWKLGYTGEGTLLASFDTGVEGDHPALISNYRGNRYPHQQCWFDPVLNDTFPHIFNSPYTSSSSIRSHGTAVLGAVIGKDDATGDTIGAAFGAEWIAAGVTDINYQNFILDALQWGADPDGDPNTSEDVPDVLSNSWGYPKYYAGCMDIFDGFISNLEALGVVVVYAAGNKGPTFRSLANPAIRVLSEYTVFSVGMINSDYDSLRVDNSSSRGPSDCDETAIKPHVVAPGRDVPLTFPLEVYPDAGGYGTGTGTSFACPHVAAAALLLRQVNPNAPVDSIKKALMHSAIDIEEPGPDSISGYGLIYLPEAMKLLPTNDQPNLYVKSVTGPAINAGDTASIEVELTNSGLGIMDVSAVVRARGDDVTVLDSSADYGAIALNDSASNSGQPYRIAFDDSISAGRMVVFDLVLNGSGGYLDTLPLYLRVGAKQEGDHFTHTAGQVQFTVSNYGIYGLGQGSASDSGGVGFIYLPDNQSYLYEMAFMIASDSDHVSDAARNMLPYSNDIDLQVAPGGGLKAYAPSFYAEERTISVFNDNGSCQPLGVEIRQSTFAYEEDIEDQFVIMAYEVKNTSDSSLTGLRVALYADWDFPYGASLQDMVGFDGDLDLGYMYANDGSAIRGIAVLNSEGTASYRSIDGAAWTRDGFAKSEKWQFMSEGFVDTASVYAKDHSHLIATGPFDLAPGQVDTAAFAIIGVDSLAEFDVVVPRAVLRFNDFMVSAENPQDPGGIPDKFELFANYPNPFNPATTIEFALDKQQAVRLEVFNILGRKVTTLVDQVLDAGYHKVVWDSSAEKVSSGVYFYRLKGENQTVSRKMLLLK